MILNALEGERAAGLRRRPAGPRLAARGGSLRSAARGARARRRRRDLLHRRQRRAHQPRASWKRSATWSTAELGRRPGTARDADPPRHRPPRPRPALRDRLQPRCDASSAGRRAATFESALARSRRWYLAHREWVDAIRSGEYLRFYEQQYRQRLQATLMKGIVLAGGSGHAAASRHAVHLQAAAAGLRQADGVLPAVGADARRHPRHPASSPRRRTCRAFASCSATARSSAFRSRYAEQAQPRGIAQAFLIGADFIGDDRVCLILGDNLFYGQGFVEMLTAAARTATGATVFAYSVRDPERYGVVELDAQLHAGGARGEAGATRARTGRSPGLYFYDDDVVRHRAQPEAFGARRAGDHRRQSRLSRARPAARAAARPRLRLARHRHAREPARRRASSCRPSSAGRA